MAPKWYTPAHRTSPTKKTIPKSFLVSRLRGTQEVIGLTQQIRLRSLNFFERNFIPRENNAIQEM